MKTLLLAFTLLLTTVPAVSAEMLTPDQMREASREGMRIRNAVKGLAELGIDAPRGASSEELHAMLMLERARVSKMSAVRCERLTTFSEYYVALHATYFFTPDGAFQVLPGNEGIVQDGTDVLFTGVTSQDGTTRGAFRIEDARLAEILDLYFNCYQ